MTFPIAAVVPARYGLPVILAALIGLAAFGIGWEVVLALPLVIRVYIGRPVHVTALTGLLILLPLCVIFLGRRLRAVAGSGRWELPITAGFLVAAACAAHVFMATGMEKDWQEALQKAEKSGLIISQQQIITPLADGRLNAATYYKQAFMLDRHIRERRSVSPAAAGMLGDEAQNRLYLLLEEAASISGCRFGDEYTRDVLSGASYYASSRNAGSFLLAWTEALLEEKLYERAWNSAVTNLRLSNCFQDRPVSYAEIARVGADRRALSGFAMLLERVPGDFPPAVRCREMLSELEMKQRLDDEHYRRFLNGELLRILSALNDQGSLSGPGRWGNMARPLLLAEGVLAIRLIMRFDELPRHPERYLLEDMVKMQRDAERSIFLKDVFLPLCQVALLHIENDAQLGGLRLALALKVYRAGHGSYPDDLRSLMPDVIRTLPDDPFTGESYAYRRQGDGFIVYSLGRNALDDGGVSDREDVSGRDDIAWRVAG